ncbi:MAG: FAD:protein FMN transferase [Dermatophilaceae bacterium]
MTMVGAPGRRPAADPHLLLDTRSWTALGTYVEVVAAADALDDAARIVDHVLAEVDLAYSRFRPDSDLERANATADAVPVAPITLAAVRLALEAARSTGGLVDPTLGGVLAGAGYDRTFTLVPADDRSPASVPIRAGSWTDVVVTDKTLTIPPGVALDLGATGKAFAADLAALTVARQVDGPVLVGVGGDLRVAGTTTEHRVVLGHSLADLADGGDRAEVTLRQGGLATSSTSARRWRRGGRQWHHLVDPRTGAPTTGPWRTVTALGHTAAAANTASTAAVVLGVAAPDWLAHRQIAARLVADDGRVVRTPAWDAAGIETSHTDAPAIEAGR